MFSEVVWNTGSCGTQGLNTIEEASVSSAVVRLMLIREVGGG